MICQVHVVEHDDDDGNDDDKVAESNDATTKRFIRLFFCHLIFCSVIVGCHKFVCSHATICGVVN